MSSYQTSFFHFWRDAKAWKWPVKFRDFWETGLWGQFLESPEPFRAFSFRVSRERRGFESSDFRVTLLFAILKTYYKTSIPKQADGNFVNGFSGPELSRNGLKSRDFSGLFRVSQFLLYLKNGVILVIKSPRSFYLPSPWNRVTVRRALPWPFNKVLPISCQSGCANLIDRHASLQSSHGCKLNTDAWVVELTYLHVVVKCESWDFRQTGPRTHK